MRFRRWLPPHRLDTFALFGARRPHAEGQALLHHAPVAEPNGQLYHPQPRPLSLASAVAPRTSTVASLGCLVATSTSAAAATAAADAAPWVHPLVAG